MKTKNITIEQFDEIYKPIEDEDGDEIMFYKWKDALKYVENNITKELPYRYIWSANDYGERYYVMQNGYHPVNNLHYLVSKEPWGSKNDKDNKNISIVADNNNYD